MIIDVKRDDKYIYIQLGGVINNILIEDAKKLYEILKKDFEGKK